MRHQRPESAWTGEGCMHARSRTRTYVAGAIPCSRNTQQLPHQSGAQLSACMCCSMKGLCRLMPPHRRVAGPCSSCCRLASLCWGRGSQVRPMRGSTARQTAPSCSGGARCFCRKSLRARASISRPSTSSTATAQAGEGQSQERPENHERQHVP